MKGYLTTFVGLFERQAGDAPDVSAIEVPLIQRDYAQGRLGAAVGDIRSSFLDVLLDAASSEEPVGLDFVYGGVDKGTLRPLDGQQRLTTLFLLHWYIASLAERLEPDAPWARFSYATRPSARLFCQRLAQHCLPSDVETPSAWLADQEWYLHLWAHDPSIQAMLVMIDAIAEKIRTQHPEFDAAAAWRRLTDTESPAVSFYLLPLEDMASEEELYIKMNSRGKPLTPFENFKARFEQDVKHSSRAEDLAHAFDGRWSDLLWPYHGGDDIVDDEFMRYLDFVIELCELREGRVVRDRIGLRARAVFGAHNPRAEEHLDLLFHAFDTWKSNADVVRSTFENCFSTALPGEAGYDDGKVTLFGATSTDLFEQCCHQFDSQTGGNRVFTLQQSLLLYAVLLHRMHDSPDFQRRLRVLRNLVAASEDEVRRENMPTLLSDVHAVIHDGDLDGVKRLSSNQVEDERLKQKFRDDHLDLEPSLARLEDHPLLRGTLSAFEFDAETFPQRAEAFERAFSDPNHWAALTAGLLATGDYQRRRPRSSGWQFGTAAPNRDAIWRYLLTSAPRAELSQTRTVLARFLDGLAAYDGTVPEYVQSVVEPWLRAREEARHYDWRYLLARYPSMREGDTGIYFGTDGELGYSMIMLRRFQLNSYYRDPVLLEIWRACGAEGRAEDPWFTGYETAPRWLRLVCSGAGVRSVSEGFELQRPENPEMAEIFDAICERHDCSQTTDGHRLLVLAQQENDGDSIDMVDRVAVGAALLQELVDRGL